jgi:hypothetical protein
MTRTSDESSISVMQIASSLFPCDIADSPRPAMVSKRQTTLHNPLCLIMNSSLVLAVHSSDSMQTSLKSKSISTPSAVSSQGGSPHCQRGFQRYPRRELPSDSL